MPELIIKLGDHVVQKYFFVNEPMSIGRAPDNEIVIENLAISRNHAVITAVDDTFLIKDLNSSNGTFVNGNKVAQTLLSDKDVIAIGKHKLHFYDTRPVREAARRPTLADADCTMLVTRVPVTAELEQIRGKHQATLHPLNGEVVRIGRGAQNDIRLSDWFVSKEHATVTRVDDAFVLRDLGSWRHTFVNDQKIDEAVLRHGDVIQIGPTVQFRFAVTSGLDLQEPAPLRLKATAMPTYEAAVENGYHFAPEHGHTAVEDSDPAPEGGIGQGLTARFDADVFAQREEENHQPELSAEAVPADEVRLEEIVEKIAAASVTAAAESLSTDPHPEPEIPQAAEAVRDAWLNPFASGDSGEQHTMRMTQDDGTEEAEEQPAAEASHQYVEDALAFAAEADQAAEPSQEFPEPSAEESLESKNDATEEQPELAEVAVAADTGAPSDEQTLGEDVRIWERALQNRSAVIRKQAARKLKQLTGKDYDY